MATKKSFSAQNFVAIMAAIMSVCALGVSLMQTYYQHKYLHASSWPHLQTEINTKQNPDPNQNTIDVIVTNKGVGPAIIESVEYEYLGKKSNDVVKLVESILGSFPTGGYKPLNAEDVIAQSENVNHLFVKGVACAKMGEAIQKIKITIVYKSIHDERWRFEAAADIPNGHRTTKLE